MPSEKKSVTDSSFLDLGSGIYLSHGQKRVADDADKFQPPTVILIFGWMGAQLPHLHKYTKVYEDIYPQATKILIRNEPSFFLTGQATREANLRPAVEVLEALHCISSKGITVNGNIPSTEPRILVHAFSNGGCYQMATLGLALSKKFSSSRLTSAIVIDSAPGGGDLRTTKRAFIGHIRNPVFYFILSLFVTTFHLFSLLYQYIFRRESAIDVLKGYLNNPHLLPWVDRSTPRLYIYSKKDQLVPWKDVARQVEESQKIGFPTHAEVFPDSPHVAHARADKGRYWAAIGKLWSAARDA